MSEDYDLLDIHHDTYVPEKADRTKIIRAPFRMAGSKYFSLKELLPRLPIKHTWVDHFGGTGIVTLNRQRSKLEVFNDRYSGVTSFYRVIKDPVKWEKVAEWLEKSVYSREEFYNCRDTWVTETDDVVRAAKWLYCTANSVMGRRVAWARATNSTPGPLMSFKSLADLFPIFHGRFRDIQIENLDFETCARDYDSAQTVHYFDPPYINTEQLYEGDYWTRNDQRRLLRLINTIDGYVALSGYYDEETDKAVEWTNKYVWRVSVKAEVDDIEKGQSGKDTDYITEYLWVKS